MAVMATGKGRRSQGRCPGPGEPTLRWLGPRWALAGPLSEGSEVRWPCVARVFTQGDSGGSLSPPLPDSLGSHSSGAALLPASPVPSRTFQKAANCLPSIFFMMGGKDCGDLKPLLACHTLSCPSKSPSRSGRWWVAQISCQLAGPREG